jgi:hypothetical protein
VGELKEVGRERGNRGWGPGPGGLGLWWVALPGWGLTVSLRGRVGWLVPGLIEEETRG